MTGTTSHTNRLSRETSPYLLQHQHNPVDWWPWGPDALAQAKRTNKPILLSVGYAACHWCHVMAHESFEDEATAAVMNAFVRQYKVDREERPDIDQIYMNALHLLGEQGGWPLTMFLTSDGEPFWGGHLFPEDRAIRPPGFTDCCAPWRGFNRDEPDKIIHNRDALLAKLGERTRGDAAARIGTARLDNGRGVDRARHRSGQRGLARRAEVSAMRDARSFCAAGARIGDDRFFNHANLAGDAYQPGRHLRSSRRRLCALLGR